MYYWSGTGAGQALRVHILGGNSFLREITSWPTSWNCPVKSKIRLGQSVRIYVKYIPTKVHLYPIWNDGAVGLLKRSFQQE